MGIGGTGCLASQSCLAFLRERFGGRRPGFVEFIVLDTTTEESESGLPLEVGDFVKIAGFNANPYFQHADDFPFLNWLPSHDYLPGEINVGAHGMPHVGRLCYFMNREGLIKRAVETKIQKLTDPMLGNSLASLPGSDGMLLEREAIVRVHLVVSLCGGTGAGCVLDAAYDLRRWIEQMTGHRPLIIGHLVLPEAFQIRCSEMTHRKLCKHIGRMIRLLATEYAGKQLWDRMINTYPGMHAQGDEKTELRTYSSYELAFGTRPFDDAVAEVIRQVFQRFAQMGAQADARTADHSAHIELNPHFDEDRLREQLTTKFRHDVDELVHEMLNNTAITEKEAGSRFITLVHRFLDSGTTAARQLVADDAAAWMRDESSVQPVLDALQLWFGSAHPVRSLAGHLAALRAQIDQQVTQVRALLTKRPDQVADGIRQSAAVDADKLFFEETRNRVRGQVEREFASACLRAAWASYFAAAAERLKKALDQVRRQIGDMGKECGEYCVQRQAQARDERGESTATRSERLNLYQISGNALDDPDVRTQFDRILKRLLLSLVACPAPQEGYVRAITRKLTEQSEFGETIQQILDAYFTKYERQALIESDQSQHADELKAGVQSLLAAASPRWVVDPDTSVEQVGCLVYPATIPLDRVVNQLNQEVDPVPEETYAEALMAVTQHGASLQDLKNFDLYETSFDETAMPRMSGCCDASNRHCDGNLNSGNRIKGSVQSKE